MSRNHKVQISVFLHMLKFTIRGDCFWPGAVFDDRPLPTEAVRKRALVRDARNLDPSDRYRIDCRELGKG